MSSFDLYLDSRNSITNDPADCSFNLGLGSLLFNSSGMSISVESFMYPNLEPNVNSKNNLIVFQENGVATDISLTLSEGYYTGTGLSSELQTQLNAEGSNTYSVSYNSITGRLTITVTSGTSIKIIGDSELLGIIEGNFQASITSDLPVRLDGSLYVDITSNLHTSNVTSDGVRNVLKRVPLSVNPQQILFYTNPNDSDSMIVTGGSLDTIQIRLVDDKGFKIILPSSAHWAMNLRVTVL